MRMKYPVVVLCLAAALLQACASGGELKRSQAALEAKKEASSQQSQSAERLAVLAMENAPSPDTDYIIGPDDLLDIRVYQAGDLGGVVMVSAQNLIDMPLIGDVSTKGMTPAMLQQKIALKLKEYIKQPFVTVIVKRYRAQMVSVVGAVNAPKVYSMTGPKRLLDMLAGAGGLTPKAGQFCTVLRPGAEPGQPPTTMVIDLSELLDKGNLALNVPIRGGDIINVQKAGMVYIDGEVRRADAYRLRRGTTLVKAVAMAGGLKKDADNSHIRIYRDNGQGGRNVITADFDAINKGRQPDVKLAANDIVIVSRSGAKAVLFGILNTVRGYFNFGNFGAGGGFAP